MKSPLRKRIPRELKGEIGKYLVVFILMVATIGLVSGFLVADGSMIHGLFAPEQTKNWNVSAKEGPTLRSMRWLTICSPKRSLTHSTASATYRTASLHLKDS